MVGQKGGWKVGNGEVEWGARMGMVKLGMYC